MTLTDINLNDNNQTTNINTSNPTAIADAPSDYTMPPPASELPSYNEALRLKKQEANEVPPSYYPTANNPTESRHIIIEESDVSRFLKSTFFYHFI
jgi:hypothetical protein